MKPFAGVCLLLLASALSEAGMVTRRWGTPPSGPPGKAEKAVPARPPTALVPETKAPPKIDGKLDDKAWEKASVLWLERTLDGTARAAQPTEVRLLRDAKTLFVAIRCLEPQAEKLRAQRRNHDDAVWLDDSLELFLGFGATYYQFGINAVGSTYDAKGKDASWDSGLAAAAAIGKDDWTAELALPLDKLAGDKQPKSWIANFCRNRQITGTTQESAWSPTYSGDSHVPERFGQLILRDPPREQTRQAPAAAGERNGLKPALPTLLPCKDGEGVVRFDLSDLPKGTRVYRADLLIFRSALVTGASGESLVDIEVYQLEGDFSPGGEPKPRGKPLALREPLLDRLDVTEAIRHAARGSRLATFFVKTCPLWNAQATCLEVAFEGDPKDVPAPATEVKAFHRAGQTFITWREVAPLVTAETATWGEIKAKLAEARDACSYRIYAHTKPISARTLPDAALIAEVGPLSAYNVNARNKEYLIGQAMLQPDEMGELARDYNGYMHTWTADSPRMDRYPVPRFVIDEQAGPLPVGTGLYVHQPGKAGTTYYAVVSVRNGVESTAEVASVRVPDEAVGPGRPVCQGAGLQGPFFDYPGYRRIYVQWCAPPLAPRPNMAFNWSVLTPPNVERVGRTAEARPPDRVPCELYFHPEGYSYAQPGKKMLAGSIQLAPHDWPPSGWYGFNSSWGTLRSFRAGTVSNHTQRRIIAFLEWARGEFPIDPDRVLAVGADGAAALALNYRDEFAYVLITGFDRQGVLEPKAADKFAAAWGLRSKEIRDERGRAEWAWANLDELALASPGKSVPLFVCRGPSWGGDPGWGKGWGRLYRAMLKAGQPLVAHWAWGGQLAKPDWHTGLWRGVDIRRDAPLPAFANCSLDQEGEGSGNCNMGFAWKDIAEAPDRFEVTILSRDCTFDLTPRRLRQFQVKPGEKLRWEAAPLPGRGGVKPQPQSGEIEADAAGLITLRGLIIPRDCPGLKVLIARTK